MILSKIMLTIAIMLVFSSVYFNTKAANTWMLAHLEEDYSKLDDEKRFTKLGWTTFILGGILGLLSFNI